MSIEQMAADASKRPTDRELIQGVAWAHSASFSEAAEWLSNIDFEALK